MTKMERSFGLFFHLKKNAKTEKQMFTVYMRVTIDGDNCEISSKRKCEPEKWNKIAGRMMGKGDAVWSFNAYLDTLQQKILEAKRKLIETDQALNAENVKNLLLEKSNQRKHMQMEIFKNHNNQMASLVGQEYAPGTLQRYETSFRHTQSFLRWKYKVADINISKLDFEFITDYEFWLKSMRKRSHNTTIKYLSNFKKIVNRCLRNGWLSKDPFLQFNMRKREVERTPLTEFELNALRTKKFEIQRLAFVRDIFLFSCMTGLAYADVKKLKRSEISIGVDGEKWIFSKRRKTDIISRIPLSPIAVEILNRYSDHPVCKADDRVLPVLSNQKMNAYLKEISDLCGITKCLTYHIARHTFATTITLNKGVPIETVSKMLGHRNLKTTQHYAKFLDKKIGDDMKNIRSKFF